MSIVSLIGMLVLILVAGFVVVLIQRAEWIGSWFKLAGSGFVVIIVLCIILQRFGLLAGVIH